MIKKILSLKNVEQLTSKQQKMIKGGYIPTPYEFCCGHRPQSFWIANYPFIANDPYYSCTGDICENGGW